MTSHPQLWARALSVSVSLARARGEVLVPSPCVPLLGRPGTETGTPGPAPTPRKAGGPRKACPGRALLPSRPWACPSVSNDRAQVTHDCNLWEGREERGREHSPALRPSRLRRECVPVMGSLQGASHLPSPDLCQPQPAPRGGPGRKQHRGGEAGGPSAAFAPRWSLSRCLCTPVLCAAPCWARHSAGTRHSPARHELPSQSGSQKDFRMRMFPTHMLVKGGTGLLLSTSPRSRTCSLPKPLETRRDRGRHRSKCSLPYPHEMSQQTCAVQTPQMIPKWQMKKVRRREVKGLVQRHAATKGWSWDLNPG